MGRGRIFLAIIIVIVVIIVFVYLFITSWLEENREEKKGKRSK